jgi:MFS transporter, DHA1 family, multidrug resistance protein
VTDQPATATAAPAIRMPSTPELVGMVAAFMALNALGIDIMLPALPDIARDFGVHASNDRQLVIIVYMLSFGVAQLFFGPLSDAFGRRPVLLWAMGFYLVATLACVAAPSFLTFLIARGAQGAGAAAARIIAVAVVRDTMSGREMARVMSMAMMVFMVVPILAPGLGQIVLLFGPWRWIFVFLALAALAVIAWTWLRLPETRPPETRSSLRIGAVLGGYLEIARQRQALGYAIASTFLFASLTAFIATAQQIFAEHFRMGAAFPLAFATVAGIMSVASFINSRLVMRLGMHRIGHAALIGFTLVSAAHGLLLLWVSTPLAVYLPLLALAMLLFGMIGANFNAIVMEPLGARAGAGAAFYGFFTTFGAAIVGGAIARQYDGTPAPFILGSALVGAMAILAVFITERGRLFGSTGARVTP